MVRQFKNKNNSVTKQKKKQNVSLKDHEVMNDIVDTENNFDFFEKLKENKNLYKNTEHKWFRNFVNNFLNTQSDTIDFETRFSKQFGVVDYNKNEDENLKGVKEQKLSKNAIEFNDEIPVNAFYESDSEYPDIKDVSGSSKDISPSYSNSSGKTSFACTIGNCNKVYTSSYGLKYHMGHGHTIKKSSEKRPFACNFENCSKTYKNNNGLKYHIIHAHKGKFVSKK